MRQEPRLQFTKEERADPALEKPIRKADRAADKAEKARAKIPKKKIRFEETVTDPATGKTVTRLRFEEVDKKSRLPSCPMRYGTRLGTRSSPKYTRKSGSPRKIMWVWRAPIRWKKLLKRAGA